MRTYQIGTAFKGRTADDDPRKDFAPSGGGGGDGSWVRRLMCAILLDAFEVLETARRCPTPCNLQEARRAAEWIRDEAERYALSFRNVCAVLDLDPVHVRQCLVAKGLLR